MDKNLYRLELAIPGRDGENKEVRRYQIAVVQGFVTGRHEVMKGRLIVDQQRCWWLLQENDKPNTEVNGFLVTQYSPRRQYLTGEEYVSADIDPSSPYAQAVIKALYYFNEYTDVVRRHLLARASENWIRRQREIETREYEDSLVGSLARGYLTVERARQVISEYAAHVKKAGS